MIGAVWAIVGLAIVAVAAPFICKLVWPHRIEPIEIVIGVVVAILIGAGSGYWLVYGDRINVEILNGKVVDKTRDEVSCEHSYQICSGTGNSKVCTTHYEHSYDVDWNVHTTVGTIRIPRVDRRGTTKPRRWADSLIGEPAAIENSYVDYTMGVKHTLLYTKNSSNPEFAELTPTYPRVYDHYRVKPVIFMGIPQASEPFVKAVRDMMRDVGPRHQVNFITVVVNTPDVAYGEWLKNEWRNGRKNDQVLVVGAPDWPNIKWATSFGWSENEIMNKKLPSDVMKLDQLTPENLVSTFKDNVGEFKRRPMESFEHYLFQAEVGIGKLILVILAQVLSSIGLGIFFYKHDFN